MGATSPVLRHVLPHVLRHNDGYSAQVADWAITTNIFICILFGEMLIRITCFQNTTIIGDLHVVGHHEASCQSTSFALHKDSYGCNSE